MRAIATKKIPRYVAARNFYRRVILILTQIFIRNKIFHVNTYTKNKNVLLRELITLSCDKKEISQFHVEAK